MKNSIFVSNRFRDLERRADLAADAVGVTLPDLLRIGLARVCFEIENTGKLVITGDGSASPANGTPETGDGELLTPKTRRRIQALDHALGGGWFETKFQDLLETVIAEDWTTEAAKACLPSDVTFAQFSRLKTIREQWIAEDSPPPSPSEKGLTDGRSKPGKKKRPHPLFGDAPKGRRNAA